MGKRAADERLHIPDRGSDQENDTGAASVESGEETAETAAQVQGNTDGDDDKNVESAECNDDKLVESWLFQYIIPERTERKSYDEDFDNDFLERWRLFIRHTACSRTEE
jgi:glycine cleavage system H lipoate-binding protein